MSNAKQHELGLAGLALLRNWLVGDEKTRLWGRSWKSLTE